MAEASSSPDSIQGDPRRLFVTGGSGFLGRRIVAAALGAGLDVTVLSRRASPPGLPEGVATMTGDVTDTAALPEALARARPDVVIHAAAIVTNEDPHLHNVNVTGTANLTSAMERLQPRPRMVYVSSFTVEDIPPTPYSESKLEAEAVVRAGPLPFVILRPTLIYGPGDANNTDILVKRMRGGNMWLPAGGTALIQPVFVDDVAAACVAAATRPGLEGKTYRLGGDAPLSVCAWREAVRDATGGAGRIRSIPLPLYGLAARSLAVLGVRKPLGVLQFHLADHAVDGTDARRDLGFSPRPVSAGLEATFGQDGD